MNLATKSDKQLLAHFIKTNDESVFDALCERHRDNLAAWIEAHYLADHVAAEYVASETFIVVRDKCREFAGESFQDWLYTIAGNLCINYGPIERPTRESDPRVLKVLARLPELEGQVLSLLMLDNLTASAAAKQLGVTCHQIHKAFDSALAKFKCEWRPC